MIFGPGRAQGCAGGVEDLGCAVTEYAGRLAFHIFGVREVESPAAVAGEVGQYLAVHEESVRAS